MADVLVYDGAGIGGAEYRSVSYNAGIFMTSTLIGYFIHYAAGDVYYTKTTDGGVTWSANIMIFDAILYASCWADWQTPGDSGTKIHIVAITHTGAGNDGSVQYRYLDTATDTLGDAVEIEACQGSGVIGIIIQPAWDYCAMTKARGGNLMASFRYVIDENDQYEGTYTSADGITWTSKTGLGEDADFGDNDYFFLFPGNESDSQDIWCIFYDNTADELSLKTFDNSANTWSEQSIATGLTWTVPPLAGDIMHSDRHLFLVYHHSTTIYLWDINGSGSITAKTSPISGSDVDNLAAVTIDQTTDAIYAVYCRGTPGTSELTYYKKSVDGGTTWGTETA